MLVDSLGYAYTKKWQKNPSGSRTTWICSIRSKAVRCPASVVQTGNQYTRGIHCHLHQARPGGDTALEIVATVNNNARDNMFQSAAAIVDEAICDRLNDVPSTSCPKPANLARITNRTWQANRPADPKDLMFDVATDFIIIPEDFL